MSGRPHGPSDPSAIRPGQQFDTTYPQRRAQVARDSWSSLMAFGHGPASPERAGRHCGTSVPGQGPPGHLVNAAGTHAQARFARKSRSTKRALGPECESPGWWSYQTALRHGPESHRTAVRPRWASDPTASHAGDLVDTAGVRTWARVARDTWSTLQGLRQRPEWSGRAGRPSGRSDMGPSRLGELVDTTGPRTWDRVARERWSTRGTSDLGLRPPGQLDATASPLNRVRVTRKSGSTPRALGYTPETPWTAGQTCGPSNMDRSAPGH